MPNQIHTSLPIFPSSGVGPRDFRILRTYWDWLRMVTRSGGHYMNLFKGFRGVTQGDPLSPSLFNVVVDAVVRHWVEEMVEIAGGKGRRVREG